MGYGLPGGSEVKNLPAMRETWVQSLGWEDALEREWLPTPVFLDRGARWATVHMVARSLTRLSDFHFTSYILVIAQNREVTIVTIRWY